MNKQQIIDFYLENNTLLSPELIEYFDKPFPISSRFIVLNTDALLVTEHGIPINILDYERALVCKEKNKNKKIYEKFKEYIISDIEKKLAEKTTEVISGTREDEKSEQKITVPETFSDLGLIEHKKRLMEKHRIRIIHNYDQKNRKRTVQDFVNYFNSRFKELEKILRARQELQNLTSISRITSKKEKENVALIGMVYEKRLSKNNNIILNMEDPTGTVSVVITRSREELFNLAQEIQLDEIIGVTGTYDNIVFANNLLLPDIPLTKELKKSPEEGYFVLITDPQVGNKLFLEQEFKKCIQWIKGNVGNEQQKEISSKIKYLFIAGDMVDGVGIFPGQEYDLNIIDVKEQYNKIAEYLSEITDIPIIICPGNHDVGRMSEPQPGLKDEYSSALWKLPNVISVSNPSLINIFSSKDFEGLDVLLYHGGSFIYYCFNVQSIRQNGGLKRSDMVMKYLLQRRHLAPTHASTIYIPDPSKDPLVIDRPPDFFFSGHIHRASVTNYRNVTCINASCWVSKSAEQERRGIEPQPARAFLINMQTREVKIMNFLSKGESENG